MPMDLPIMWENPHSLLGKQIQPIPNSANPGRFKTGILQVGQIGVSLVYKSLFCQSLLIQNQISPSWSAIFSQLDYVLQLFFQGFSLKSKYLLINWNFPYHQRNCWVFVMTRRNVVAHVCQRRVRIRHLSYQGNEG